MSHHTLTTNTSCNKQPLLEGRPEMGDVIKHTVSSPATLLKVGAGNHLIVRLPKTGFFGASLMLFKAMVGAGLFALPYAFKLMGFGGGIVAMAVIAALTWYTNMLIVRVHDVVVRDTLAKDLTYVSLVKHCFGKVGGAIVYGLIVFTTVGSLTAYLLFMAQVCNSMLPQLSIIAWAAIMGAAALPLMFLRNNTFLAYTSMLGNVGVALVVATVLARGGQNGHITRVEDYTSFKSSTFMQAFGIVGFLFACSTNVLTVSKAMAKKEQFGSAMSWTMAFTCVSCAGFAVVNYLYYGADTCSIIVLNSGSGPLALTAKIAIVIDLLFTYPLAAAPAREVIERSIFTESTPHLYMKQIVVRTLLVTATFLVCFFPQFSIIMNIVGGWSVSVLAFVLPCLMLLQLRRFHLKAFESQTTFIKENHGVTRLASTPAEHTDGYKESANALGIRHKVVNIEFEGDAHSERHRSPSPIGAEVTQLTVRKLLPTHGSIGKNSSAHTHGHGTEGHKSVNAHATGRHRGLSAETFQPPDSGKSAEVVSADVTAGTVPAHPAAQKPESDKAEHSVASDPHHEEVSLEHAESVPVPHIDAGHAQSVYEHSVAGGADAHRRGSIMHFFSHLLAPAPPIQFDPWTADAAVARSASPGAGQPAGSPTTSPILHAASAGPEVHHPHAHTGDSHAPVTGVEVSPALPHTEVLSIGRVVTEAMHRPKLPNWFPISKAGAPHASPAPAKSSSEASPVNPSPVHSHKAEVLGPSHVNIHVHGHQLHRPRGNTSLDVVTLPHALRPNPLATHAPTISEALVTFSSETPANASGKHSDKHHKKAERIKALAAATKSRKRHVDALLLLGVGSAIEKLFLILVTLFGVAVLILTTVQSISEAINGSQPEPAVCSAS